MSSQDICRSLEITFGKIPKLIFDNIQYFTYDGEFDEFKCVPCNFLIKLHRHNEENTTINFEQHLSSDTHKINTVHIDEVWSDIISTFKNEIPQEVENNFWLFSVNGNFFECIICEERITARKYSSITENNFLNHLLTDRHEENLEDCMENICQLQLIYGGIPDIIINNKQFLSFNWSDGNYSCTLCEEIIEVIVDDLDETRENFKHHLSCTDHVNNAKQANAFSKIPELLNIFEYLPNYMLRNVHYISTNETGDKFSFYCTLCCENITFEQDDPSETEHNLKQHFFSELHEQYLIGRRNPNNEVFIKIKKHFDSIPEHVSDQFKYLILDGLKFECFICNETIDEGEELNETARNILDHFESNDHIAEVENEMDRCTLVLNDLKYVFGNIPHFIITNIPHIELNGLNSFKCVLCSEIINCKCDSDYEQNTSVTEYHFANHLNSKNHLKKLKEFEHTNEELEHNLTQRFIHIPQFIINNLHYIRYNRHSDDFLCSLCGKTIIAVANGMEKEDITLLNFTEHLLSAQHSSKVKQEANRTSKVREKLDHIFGCIPKAILNNVEHIVRNGDNFHCRICNAPLKLGNSVKNTEYNFLKHLCGYHHTENEKFLEQETDRGFHELDNLFWRIPEFLLRNIDFLSISGDDLFCTLCQVDLPFDVDDLENTKLNLRCHMDSEIHQFNLEPSY